MSSKIFVGYRALGFISNHIPLKVRYIRRRNEHLVVTVVGRCFHTYGTDKFHLMSISSPHPDDITCTAVDSHLVYTSYQNVIQAFIRGTELRYTFTGHEEDVCLLFAFGSHLLSVDKANVLKIWVIRTQEVYSEITFDKSFKITCIMHPNTYLNKILLGSHQGELQLWNIRTNKLIYTFTKWDKPITVLEQAPAVDVVAIGLQSGQVILHNIKYNETIITFTQEWGPVTSIAFRTDGHPIMMTGSSVGHIALWDLENRKISGHIQNAHNGPVTGMKSLPSEPLMVTSSPDNTLKMWIFDMPDHGGRLLKLKEGHAAPPTKISFYGSDGCNILSAGQDSSLRSFSTIADILNKNFGKASFNKKRSKKLKPSEDSYHMPYIVSFDSEKSRESDWDNIVTCHRGLSIVTTWSYQRCTMGSYKLQPTRFIEEKHLFNSIAKCVAITSCGNFVVIGYSSGHIDIFNLQSGQHRGSFGKPSAHDRSVRGVSVDHLNQLTISGGGDRCLKFWNFKSRKLLEEVKLEVSADQLLLNRDSCLLVIILENFELDIFDINTRKKVRKFFGHTSLITDVTFGMSGKWLISASMDSTIRTWDLPTSNLVDCFLLDSACTSISMSPNQEFLATSHVDDLGIYLWANKTLFSYVSLSPLPFDFEPCSVLVLPGSEKNKETEEMELDEEEFEFVSPQQIATELVTLSELPRSRWHSLFYLEIIKQRNKPKEPPKKPKAAPFFIPTIPGLEMKFGPLPEQKINEEATSKVVKLGQLMDKSEFRQLLLDYAEDHHKMNDFMQKLKQLGPSAIDTEIRALSPEGGGSLEVMIMFMNFLMDMLETRQEFELIQSFLGHFLKVHGDEISKEEELIDLANRMFIIHSDITKHIQDLSWQILGTVAYFKSAII